jgi:hypothetical protein
MNTLRSDIGFSSVVLQPKQNGRVCLNAYDLLARCGFQLIKKEFGGFD